MATKSILKNITIRDYATSYSLIQALENAKNKGSKKIQLTKTVVTADRDRIRKLFGEK